MTEEQQTTFELGQECLRKKNYKEAFRYFKKGGMWEHCGKCQYQLYLMYRAGCGVEYDREESDHWMGHAANNGNPDAMCAWAARYINAGDYSGAYELYSQAANKGHALSIFNIGKMYEYGHGLKQSNAIAMEWYLKAADLDLPEALHEIAQFYFRGKGVKKDDKKAMEWYLKCSKLGHSAADYNIGSMYHNGEGVEQDFSKAMEWFLKAAEEGHELAQFNLGSMYSLGQGIDKVDPITAFKWYHKALMNGVEIAAEQLDTLYRDHRDVLRENIDFDFDKIDERNERSENEEFDEQKKKSKCIIN